MARRILYEAALNTDADLEQGTFYDVPPDINTIQKRDYNLDDEDQYNELLKACRWEFYLHFYQYTESYTDGNEEVQMFLDDLDRRTRYIY